MKSLRQILLERITEKPCWVVRGSGTLRIGNIMAVISVQDLNYWRGKRVAIGALPTCELLLTLLLLDGLAEQILFLPDEEDAAVRLQRLSQSQVDIILDGNGLNLVELIGAEFSNNNHFDPSLINDNPTTWLLPTSGTTGIPKLIPHTVSSLTRNMKPPASGASKVWGSLYSIKRFAGLQVFLQSLVAQETYLVVEDKLDFSAKMQFFIDNGCSALSATPSMWRKISMHSQFHYLNLIQITLGGEIVDQFLLDHLKQKFPQARITHIYASTEAGVGFSVKDGLSGFPIHYLTSNPTGIQFKISDDNRLFYNLKRSFSESHESQWVDSGDVVKVDGDRVYFLGRANGSINVGGNKVMPEEVESIIKELPEILFVQVKGKKNPILGSLVEAEVIVKNGFDLNAALKKKIITHCSSKLESFKVPAIITPSSDIQVTSAGKIKRN
jgi:acyl-CoA synthetase (AMP-forming)/AMP-acid ligase II